MVRELSPGDLDLSEWIRPGDCIFWGHGTSEPQTLSEAVVSRQASWRGAQVWIGVSYSDTLRPGHTQDLDVRSYCALGSNQALYAHGALQIIPSHISQVPDLIDQRVLRPDVVLMQWSAANAQGQHSLGLSHDYLWHAARSARCVLVEVNDQAPWTYCDESLRELPVQAIVHTSRPVLEVPTGPVGVTEAAIADHVAELIPDRAVLQMGIGSLPGAILARLKHHQDLGVHSGLVGDGLVDLVECGALTNRFKTADTGMSVTGMLAGTKRLYAHAHLNPALRLRPVNYTHHHGVLSSIQRMHAINSALEVDLTGQVNAEMLGSRYVGAIGGQVDFVRGATCSKGGRAITVLPSTASQGRISRIVASLPSGVVTTARSDADTFVTEWGIAELRGRSLAERARRMIAIAHPNFRDELTQSARSLFSLH